MAGTFLIEPDVNMKDEKLAKAQRAVLLPEVQEMMKKLAEYNLGVYMPHIHEDEDGEFAAMPDGVVQVESGLEVTFHQTSELEERKTTLIPVGWFWRDGTPSIYAGCSAICERYMSTDSRGKPVEMHRRGPHRFTGQASQNY